MEHYSTIKKWNLTIFGNMDGMGLKGIILSEISQTEKDTYPKISLLEGM